MGLKILKDVHGIVSWARKWECGTSKYRKLGLLLLWTRDDSYIYNQETSFLTIYKQVINSQKFSSV